MRAASARSDTTTLYEYIRVSAGSIQQQQDQYLLSIIDTAVYEYIYAGIITVVPGMREYAGISGHYDFVQNSEALIHA